MCLVDHRGNGRCVCAQTNNTKEITDTIYSPRVISAALDDEGGLQRPSRTGHLFEKSTAFRCHGGLRFGWFGIVTYKLPCNAKLLADGLVVVKRARFGRLPWLESNNPGGSPPETGVDRQVGGGRCWP